MAIGGAGAGGRRGLIIVGSGGSGSCRVSHSTGGITAVATRSAGVGRVGIVVLVVLTGMVIQLGLRVRMMRMLAVGKLLGVVFRLLLMSLMRGHGSGEISKGRLSIFHRRETAYHGDRRICCV